MACTHTEKLVQTACELLRRLEISTEGLLHHDSQEGLFFPWRCRLWSEIFVNKLATLSPYEYHNEPEQRSQANSLRDAP